jgi:hypothetical protein
MSLYVDNDLLNSKIHNEFRYATSLYRNNTSQGRCTVPLARLPKTQNATSQNWKFRIVQRFLRQYSTSA